MFGLTGAATSGTEVVYLVFLSILFPVPAFIAGVRQCVVSGGCIHPLCRGVDRDLPFDRNERMVGDVAR
jgi:hypothetical protein